MSAIVGIFHRSSAPLAPGVVEDMLGTLVHRGPDFCRIWIKQPVGLGHRGLDYGMGEVPSMPLMSRQGHLVVTADARLDNREQLIQRLEPASGSDCQDAELILAAYQEWGRYCPQELIGDFAFAIWDPIQRELFCARDRMGVKPFYYYVDDHKFVFASEPKGIFAAGGLRRRANDSWIATLFHPELITSDRESTAYKGILRLPPATTMTVTRHRLRQQSYWSLAMDNETRFGRPDECAEAYREIFEEAVRCRLRDTDHVGAALSGGLDSSSIVCVARNQLNDAGRPKLQTFTADFSEHPEAAEHEYINEVVQQGGILPHMLYPDRQTPLIDIERVLWHLDQPFFGPNYFMPWSIYQNAAQRGVRAFLDGVDGNTVVSDGMDYLALLARKGLWKLFGYEARTLESRMENPLYANAQGLARTWAVPEIQKLAKSGQWRQFLSAVRALGRELHLSQRELIMDHGLPQLMPNLMRSFASRFRPAKPTDSDVPFFSEDFLERSHLEDRLLEARIANAPQRDGCRGEHHRSLTSGLYPFLLELMNHMGAAHGVDVRTPFSDHRLVEFCLSLPPEQKLHGGWTRLIMRQGMQGVLPRKIQWRGSKASLAGVYGAGLDRFEKKRLDNVVYNGQDVWGDYLDPRTLKRVYTRYQEHKSNVDRQWIWRAVNLYHWLEFSNHGGYPNRIETAFVPGR